MNYNKSYLSGNYNFNMKGVFKHSNTNLYKNTVIWGKSISKETFLNF